jgi:hypothetical protein
MGQVVPDADVLDARFVGALWPLVAAGWPAAAEAPADNAPFTTLVVDGGGVTGWALPMAALGLALAGAVPFASVAVQPLHGLSALDTSTPVDLDELLASGRAAARVALAWSSLRGGRVDAEAARQLVTDLANPSPGSRSVDDAVAACDEAFASGCPAVALPALADAARRGVSPGNADRLRALAGPLFGD